jgi:hypothetical protein
MLKTGTSTRTGFRCSHVRHTNTLVIADRGFPF